MLQAIKLRKSISNYKNINVSPKHLQKIKTIILEVNDNKFYLFLENKNILTKKILKDTNHIDMGIGLSHLYNSAIELGYMVELKKAPHDEIGSS
ncbi:hypothetical protein [Clostridium sp.]|uniref:hypothetical protein n=1 Tax=Clostridium sp. TaxID=1506 RepID=UPI002639105D|nr:hypothetical protein [uncultured Clostridium sp.]